jgi:RNA polymerase sigma-70 factor (ECF subfamily)
VATIDRARSPEFDLESHRRALTGYCYRMLGAGSEAEDAVQETMVRAWKNADKLESQAALKSWLYRIATNVCLDMLQAPQRRARPVDLNGPASASHELDPGRPMEEWVLPIADAAVLPEVADPAELAAEKETIRLAFVAALQHLPPKQRAVLILREVLRWKAEEVAQLLDTSVASVNSALQRARATLESADIHQDATAPVVEDDELLARYVDTFTRYDIDELVKLVHEDASFSMPPWEMWICGPRDIHDFMLGPGGGCRGSKVRLTRANGRPAVGQYKPGEDGKWEPWNLCVLDFRDGRITALHNFIFTELFEQFGLPMELGPDDETVAWAGAQPSAISSS